MASAVVHLKITTPEPPLPAPGLLAPVTAPPPPPTEGKPPQETQEVPAGVQPQDTQGTGGGTIGTGSVPTPDEPGFTGTRQ